MAEETGGSELWSPGKVIQLVSTIPLWVEGDFGDMVNVWNQKGWVNETEVIVDQYKNGYR